MLGRQAFAAFVAPPLEDRSTGFRTHAHAKPVGLLALAFIGLIGPFHISSLIAQRLDGPSRPPHVVRYPGTVTEEGGEVYKSAPPPSITPHASFLRIPFAPTLAPLGSRRLRPQECVNRATYKRAHAHPGAVEHLSAQSLSEEESNRLPAKEITYGGCQAHVAPWSDDRGKPKGALP